MRRYYEKELLPWCISIGISAAEFWTLSPRTLQPYYDGYELKRKEIDRQQFYNSLYTYEAFSTVIANAFRKKNSPIVKYRDKPLFESIAVELTEDNYEAELQKALFAEEMWIKNDKRRGLPETIIA